MDNYFDENEFDFIDALAEKLPREAVKMIDYKRYETMLVTALKLEKLLSEIQESGEINVDVNEVFNNGSVSVEIPELLVSRIQDFISIVSATDNFEITRL